jgi:trans-aconitate 2-methyltransferase
MTSRVEWNAERYHEVSRPHVAWGDTVLDRVPIDGIAVAIDAGCGTGKITRALLERLPGAVVYAVDVSPTMLAVAERELVPDFGARIRIVQANLAEITPQQIGTPADLIFSTATFHWLHDHDQLFRQLFALLRPGGRLIAQCGGGPNLRAMLTDVDRLMRSPQFARYFEDWRDPWVFASAEETAARLNAAGFAAVDTAIEPHPVQMATAEEYRAFITTVILRDQLSRLPTDQLRRAFADELTRQAAATDAPFSLDYWRLNISAARPI